MPKLTIFILPSFFKFARTPRGGSKEISSSSLILLLGFRGLWHSMQVPLRIYPLATSARASEVKILVECPAHGIALWARNTFVYGNVVFSHVYYIFSKKSWFFVCSSIFQLYILQSSLYFADKLPHVFATCVDQSTILVPDTDMHEIIRGILKNWNQWCYRLTAFSHDHTSICIGHDDCYARSVARNVNW